MVRARVVALAFFGTAITLTWVAGCSIARSDRSERRLGVSRQAILTPAPNNVAVTTTAFPNRHEFATVFLTLNQPLAMPPSGRWLTVWNGPTGANGVPIGWAPSMDGLGNGWTPDETSMPSQFGSPGISPSVNRAFNHYSGDPGLAPVTNPDLNPAGNRAILVELASTTAGADLSDVVALLWDGTTFTSPGYVTTGSFEPQPNPPFPDSGGSSRELDIPHVASNPASPYDTFVVWEQNTLLAHNTWMRRIWYNGAGQLCGGPSDGSACPAPVMVPGGLYRPNIAVGFLHDINGVPLTGCSSGGEAVFLVSASTNPGRCDPNAPAHFDITWRLQIYDVALDKWYGPWALYHEPSFPVCVGRDGTGQAVTSNTVDPHIAVDTSSNPLAVSSDYFWVTHTIGRNCGNSGCPAGQMRTSEVAAEFGWLGCPSGPPPGGCIPEEPCPQIIPSWSPPAPTGTTAAWIPAIASSHVVPWFGQCVATDFSGVVPNLSPPCQRTVVYWYATYPDQTNNRLASVYMSYEENYGLFTLPQAISVKNNSSEVVPWNNDLATTWDFQHLGVNTGAASFMAIWNDPRDGTPHFWSSLMQ